MASDEELKKKDLFGFDESDEEQHSEDEAEVDDRFAIRHLRKTGDLLGLDNKDTEGESDSDEESGSDHGESNSDQEDISDNEAASDKEEKSEEEQHSDNDQDGNDQDSNDFDENDQDNTERDEYGRDAAGNDDLGITDKGQPIRKKKKIRKLTPEELIEFEKAQKRMGVCYLSTIPRFMTPVRVRQLLSKYAEINRLFLQPEDPKVTARRQKYKKDSRINYIEGWVEFMDKKQAKAVAEYLNLRQVGGKRQSKHYHDIWNIKYLPKFKWNHLTEQIAYERRAREHRMQAEIAQAKRENKLYIRNVERAKMVEAIEKRKHKNNEEESDGEPLKKIKRTFAQRDKVERSVDESSSRNEVLAHMDDKMKGVLGNVFGKH